MKESAAEVGDEIAAVKMQPPRRRWPTEVAILWRMRRRRGRDEMVNTLLQHSHPPVSPSNFLPLPLSFPSLVRSVDYEDTSSSLTVWPLRHVLMRSASLHCIINKSEKWLFLCLFPSHGSLSPPFLCLVSGGVGWRRVGVWGAVGVVRGAAEFPVRSFSSTAPTS